ncbi:17301_t:CDS:2 [Dentiscutata erythropus]|uniref:17301_t:CDS:1 n=1 Tax=Dentiscutata erythropus TaxID=1348616 RepID=A0A9N9CZJ5_9GLOM|nr:17301_t:CDS:2 [Dentiscutata erythropus]
MHQRAVKQLFDVGSFGEFPSLIEAQRIIGISRSSIGKVCRGCQTRAGR